MEKNNSKSESFTLTWKDAKTNPPKENNRYWCIVEEVKEFGKSEYQWNCYYSNLSDRWLDNGNTLNVIWWTEFAPHPIKNDNNIFMYSGIAWKHHIAEYFENEFIELTYPNGAGKGGTIFIDYNKMIEYLKNDGRSWYVAELNLENEPLIFEFDNNYMATIQRNCSSINGFKPIII